VLGGDQPGYGRPASKVCAAVDEGDGIAWPAGNIGYVGPRQGVVGVAGVAGRGRSA
jgi:hypothetical protein